MLNSVFYFFSFSMKILLRFSRYVFFAVADWISRIGSHLKHDSLNPSFRTDTSLIAQYDKRDPDAAMQYSYEYYLIRGGTKQQNFF